MKSKRSVEMANGPWFKSYAQRVAAHDFERSSLDGRVERNGPVTRAWQQGFGEGLLVALAVACLVAMCLLPGKATSAGEPTRPELSDIRALKHRGRSTPAMQRAVEAWDGADVREERD